MNDQPSTPPEPLDEQTVRTLLGLTVGESVSPAELLARRIQADPDGSWVHRALRGESFVESGTDWETIARGGASLDALRALKVSASANAPAQRIEQSLDRVLAYFVAVAAASDAHSQRITQRDPADIAESLIAIGSVLPDGQLRRLLLDGAVSLECR